MHVSVQYADPLTESRLNLQQYVNGKYATPGLWRMVVTLLLAVYGGISL
jgi:hypothetical protein